MSGNRQAFSTAMNAADRYRWDSQWAEAAREYQLALAEFPDDATARSALDFCYMQLKQWQQALNEQESELPAWLEALRYDGELCLLPSIAIAPMVQNVYRFLAIGTNAYLLRHYGRVW